MTIDTTTAQELLTARYTGPVKPKFVPFYFDVFLNDPRVNELEPEQQQQFLYLLVWMMRNEAQIAENHRTIARVLGLKSAKASERLIERLKTVGLLVASATGYKIMALSSPRLTAEYKIAAHKTQVAVEKSRKAINARWAAKAQNDDTGSNTTSILGVYPEYTSLNTPSNTDVDVEVLTPKDSTNIMQKFDGKPAIDAAPVSTLPTLPAPPKKKKKENIPAEQSEADPRGVGELVSVPKVSAPHATKSRLQPRTKDAPPYTTG